MSYSSGFLLGFFGLRERLLALHNGQMGAFRWICWWQDKQAWRWDEMRETGVIKVLLCSRHKTCLQWCLCTCGTKPTGSALGCPNQFMITPVPSWVEAVVWRWPFVVHLVSVTPGAAEQQLRQQQGILGWEARAAPSATLLSASRSSCSKQRTQAGWGSYSASQSCLASSSPQMWNQTQSRLESHRLICLPLL